jgi:hypothetical protein
VDHSHGSNSRPACFRLFKLGHYRLYGTIDMSDEMHSYIRLQQQIHDALRVQQSRLGRAERQFPHL